MKRSVVDQGWLLWALCAGAVGVSFLLTPAALPAWDLCWFKSITHHPCPGCGLTHSFLAIGHGHWAEAWVFNPFGFVWFVLALYVILRPLLRAFDRKAVERADQAIISQYFFPVLIALMLLVWGWRSFA